MYKKGMSVIGILIVAVIAGVLAAYLLPRYAGMAKKKSTTKAVQKQALEIKKEVQELVQESPGLKAFEDLKN